jgi:predicted RNA-binding protein (TIGR00451 family)
VVRREYCAGDNENRCPLIQTRDNVLHFVEPSLRSLDLRFVDLSGTCASDCAVVPFTVAAFNSSTSPPPSPPNEPPSGPCPFADPFLMPRVTVDKGAIKFVLKGADVMCPGLTNPGGDVSVDLPELAPVAIFADGKEHALAVGITKMSTADMCVGAERSGGLGKESESG